MTTRGQILRSSITGNIPTAGTRAPGEVWTNFPDLQLGVIDAGRNAQKLVAVRYFSTSANYAIGDFVVQAGVLYVANSAVTAGAFNASKWTKVAAATDAGGPYLPIAGGTLTGPLLLAADPGAALGAATKQYVDGKVTAAPYLPLAGGTLTGPVTLSGPPTIPLHAATKAYVDSGAFAAMNDNRLVNGDMRIDQRNNGASGTATNVYTVDRWQYGSNQASKGVWQQGTGTGAFPYSLKFTSSSAYASAAGDYFNFAQMIEADMVSDFQWGTANAQPVTLSFWAFCNGVSGTFSASIHNYADTRSYPFTFALLASTWTKIVVTIPGDIGGTWVMGGNAGSVKVIFDLGTGTSFRGPANAWASANYVGVTGTVSTVSAVGGFFALTGVKLETGSIATPFNRQSLAKSMADCQRYYKACPSRIITANVAAAGSTYTTDYQCDMRASPTIVVTPSAGVNWNTYDIAFLDSTGFQVRSYAVGAGASGITFNNVTASAEL